MRCGAAGPDAPRSARAALFASLAGLVGDETELRERHFSTREQQNARRFAQRAPDGACMCLLTAALRGDSAQKCGCQSKATCGQLLQTNAHSNEGSRQSCAASSLARFAQAAAPGRLQAHHTPPPQCRPKQRDRRRNPYGIRLDECSMCNSVFLIINVIVTVTTRRVRPGKRLGLGTGAGGVCADLYIGITRRRLQARLAMSA